MLRLSPVQAKNLELWLAELGFLLQLKHSPKNKIKLVIVRKEKNGEAESQNFNVFQCRCKGSVEADSVAVKDVSERLLDSNLYP